MALAVSARCGVLRQVAALVRGGPGAHRLLSAVAAAAAASPQQGSGAASPAALAAAAASAGSASANRKLPRMTAVVRSKLGSRNAQWARQNGYIPGMVYGGSPGEGEGSSIVLTYTKEADLRREIMMRRTSFLNTLFELEVDGRTEVVLPRDVELHPFRPKIICVNWLRYRPGRHPGVKLSLPLRAVNEDKAPGLKEGGWLLELMHKVPVWAHGPAIPPVLIMDLRGKRVGDKIMATELDLAPGIVLRSAQHDFAVARILGSKKSAAELAADEAKEGGGDKKDEKKDKAGGAAAAAKAKS